MVIAAWLSRNLQKAKELSKGQLCGRYVVPIASVILISFCYLGLLDYPISGKLVEGLTIVQ